MHNNGEVRFEWVVPDSASVATRGDLAGAGAALEGVDRPFAPPPEQEMDYAEAAFEPLIVIVGLIGLVHLAKQVLSFVKDTRHGGLIVDVRTESVQIRPHPSLDRGEILVLSPDGTQLFRRDAGPDLATLISALQQG